MVGVYPDAATFRWTAAGTTNSVGVWTPGTVVTVGVICDVQPANGGRYVVGAGGARLDYGWLVFTPRFSGDDAIPKDAKLVWGSVEHVVVQLFAWGRHVEVRCQD